MDSSPIFPFFGAWMVFMFGMMVIGFAATIFWIWMLIDCVQNEPKEGNDRIVWLLIILFGHGIGGLIYLLARRPERIAKYGH